MVDVTGRLILGESADALKDKVRSLLQQGHGRIVVNLGEVSYMDSSGLGALVSAHATVRRQGGALKLLNLTKRLQDLLVITKLLNGFDCYDDEAAAVASFGAA
ncbi:MAG: STAS domain-containing protein [Vicinamibacterales bacterium]